MSWHTSAIVVEGDHVAGATEFLARLGFPGLTRTGEVSGDVAGSSDLQGRAVGVVRGWTLFWDPMMFIPADARGVFEDSIWSAQVDRVLAELSCTNRIYSFLTEGTSSTHGFSWYAGGNRRRMRLWQEGEIVLEDGLPLPEEGSVVVEDWDEEGRLFMLLEALTGIAMNEVLEQTHEVYA
jgi:hypothetical protein